jgi:hypothetical protein
MQPLGVEVCQAMLMEEVKKVQLSLLRTRRGTMTAATTSLKMMMMSCVEVVTEDEAMEGGAVPVRGAGLLVSGGVVAASVAAAHAVVVEAVDVAAVAALVPPTVVAAVAVAVAHAVVHEAAHDADLAVEADEEAVVPAAGSRTSRTMLVRTV